MYLSNLFYSTEKKVEINVCKLRINGTLVRFRRIKLQEKVIVQ